MRVLLIDDHTLFLQGLKYLLVGLAEDLSFCDADSCARALDYADQPIDLVLLDLHMPGTAGMDALACIRQAFEASLVVVLSGEEDPRVIRRAIEAGASGFIPKRSTRELLLAALRLVLAGGIYLPPAVLRDVDENQALLQARHAAQAAHDERCSDGLSGRQLEVLLKVVQGKVNKVIARELHLSEGTVKSHLSAAFKVLGVQNRTEAVYMAAKVGLAPLPAKSDARL